MEWLLANPQVSSAFASLGRFEGGAYFENEDCLQTLEELISKISMEDYTIRTLRRSIGFSQNIKNDLVPLLVNTTDKCVFENTLKLLGLLTIPVECLLSVDMMAKTDIGRNTMHELNQLLVTSKEALVDLKCIVAITDYMNGILEKSHTYSSEQCENIQNCLILLRNIMYIPEENESSVLQNQLIWNLFIQNFGKLLIHLQTCSQKAYWSVIMVQLIALMYKDQHVSTLQRLLRTSFEDSLYESSEDNESNTTMQKPRSVDSSPMLTSTDPPSDSSDNGGQQNNMKDDQNFQKPFDVGQLNENSKETTSERFVESSTIIKHEKHSKQAYHKHISNDLMSYSDDYTTSQSTKMPDSTDLVCTEANNIIRRYSSEYSDCGYATQVDTPENQCASSSNDDDLQQIHHKPPVNQKQRQNPANKAKTANDHQNKQELRKKRLLKKAKTNIIKVKGLFHQPTEADISNVLKDFTVDFLIKGYNHLVKELHTQLLTDMGVRIDASHFFWIITYFLKFATLLDLDLGHISSVLSFEIVGYLTYEAVNVCEQLEFSSKVDGIDLKPCLRQMHLIVTAIREFLEAIDKYTTIAHLKKEDLDYLHNLQLQLDSAEELRCLFVLLLRCYNPKLHTKDYLTDLITTNHKLLVMLDGVSKTTEKKLSLNMVEHIRQFASVEVMYQYGFLLESFLNNGEYINDCIFTMMHHVSGELGQISILFQPHILKTFSLIWDTDYEVCDDWSDLIKYVIFKFTNTTPQQRPLPMPNVLYATIAELTADTEKSANWSYDEMDTLFWYYAQSKKTEDPIGNVEKLLKKNGNSDKSRVDVLDQLLKQGIIDNKDYKEYIKAENGELPKVRVIESDEQLEISSIENKPVDDVQILVRRLLSDTKGKLLTWLQKILMECCYVKLKLKSNIGTNCSTRAVVIMEPMIYHCMLKNHSIPLVTWNLDQVNSMSYKPFVLLLHKLGFILPADSKQTFVRIPDYWSIRNMYDIAQELGPIDKSLIKFDVNLIDQNCDLIEEKYNRHMQTCPIEDEPIELVQMLNRSERRDSFEVPTVHKSHSLVNFTPNVSTNAKDWCDIVRKAKNAIKERNTAAVVSEPIETLNNREWEATVVSKQNDDDRRHIMINEDLCNFDMSQFAIHDSIDECDEVENNDDILSDCESVASDLMYVSDEEDANDFRTYLMEGVNEFFNK